jgi:hypothetical protein
MRVRRRNLEPKELGGGRTGGGLCGENLEGLLWRVAVARDWGAYGLKSEAHCAVVGA